MRHLLPIIAAANFTAALSARSLDPVLPQISQDLAVSIPVVATLTSAVAAAFLVTQLPVGVIADSFGKPRLILCALIMLGLTNIIGAFASSFEVLFATRLLAGIAVGGTFPVAIGLIGDIVPLEERRVAMSRVLAAALTAQLLGAGFSGILGDVVGWRGVLGFLGVLMLMTSTLVAWGFRHYLAPPRRTLDFGLILPNIRRIMGHTNARIVYVGGFAEGACVFGLIPFIAAFLHDLGEDRLSIAGLVISGFACGGLFYSATVKWMLAKLGDQHLMRLGGALIGSQMVAIAFGPPWQMQVVNMALMGYGFYCVHAGLQLFNSEVAPDARATAVSISASIFNIGLVLGPILYGIGLTHLSKVSSVLTGAVLITAATFFCAGTLKFRPPAPPVGENKPSAPS